MFASESLRGAADDFSAAVASEVSGNQAAARTSVVETSFSNEPEQAAEAKTQSSLEATAGSPAPAGLAASRGPQLDAMASREFMPEPKPVVQGKLMRLVSMIIAPLRLIPPSLASAAFAIFLTGGLIVERVDVVRLFPETARLYAAVGYTVNLRGLTFRNIVTELVQEGEARVLVIEGDIANAEERTISVPLISLSVQGDDGAQLYTWTSEPQRPKLAAGDLMRFRARLVSPPPQGKNVLVRFAGREASVLYDEKQIAARNEELAASIVAAKTENLLVVAILKGSFMFAADLLRALYRAGVEPQVEFVHLSSYREATVSSGQVAILKDVTSDVRGRDVLLIDDILESGRTLAFAKDLLAARGAKRVLSAVLLEKPLKRAVQINADFVGFECPDQFVVGYGMDVAHSYRQLPFVGVIESGADGS
jgi:hypoxanthine phosphoribosyltransferase